MEETPLLNLVVLRSADVPRAAAFYEVLGLKFAEHRHGSGPRHLAAEAAGFVFEIYPLKVGAASTNGTRIGFAVASVDRLVPRLTAVGGVVATSPADSEWGRRAVVHDPDGHAVELLAPSSASPASWQQ